LDQTRRYGAIYKLKNLRRRSFDCPVCGYSGPFKDQFTLDTVMQESFCPKCHSMERHRLQYLVMRTLRGEMDFSRMSMLHFAQEHFLREPYRKWFHVYATADL